MLSSSVSFIHHSPAYGKDAFAGFYTDMNRQQQLFGNGIVVVLQLGQLMKYMLLQR